MAAVLLADSDLLSRLTLESILSAAGYAVECAATSAEAIAHLDRGEYQLVLADLRAESEEAGARLLAYGRNKEYRPATALISSRLSETGSDAAELSPESVVRISDENVTYLLARIAELIGDRADRRIRNLTRRAS
jgi:CheY-like chemotaxis protein